MATKVVLDANALLMPFESGLRIEPELERLLGSYDLLVPESVLRELAVIASQGKGQRRENAKLALTLAARYAKANVAGRGDEPVLAVAKRERAILFTNDRELLRQALAAGLDVIRTKGKGHLIRESRQGEVRG